MPTESHHRNSWFFPLLGSALGLVGVLVGYLAAPAESTEYLDLQALSDSAHRLAVVVLPGCMFSLLLAWIMGRLGWRWPARVLALLALPVFSAVLAYIIQFDRTIEDKGIAGQFVMEKPPPGRAGPVSGPYREEPEGPGLTSSPLPNGDRLILDRRTLARRGPDGSYRWNRPRPGRHPGELTVAGDTVLFAGGGAKFEDDVVVAAVDLDSGALRWSFHTLGSHIHMTVDGEWLTLTASRQSVATLARLHWIVPKLDRYRLVERPDGW